MSAVGQVARQPDPSLDPQTMLCLLRAAAVDGTPLTAGQSRATHAQRGILASADLGLVREELLRILQGSHVLGVLLEYGDVLAVIIPEIAAALNFDQRSPWHRYDVWEHTCRALAAATGGDVLVRLALLFHDLGKPICFSLDDRGRGHFYGHTIVGANITRRRMRDLCFDQEDIDTVSDLVSLHLEHLQSERVDRFLFRLGEAQLLRLLELQRADSLAHHEDAVPARMAKLDAFASALDDLLQRGYHGCS